MLSVNQRVQVRHSQAQQNFCPSASGFSLNKLFSACQPFTLVFFPPFQPAFLSRFDFFFPFPSLSAQFHFSVPGIGLAVPQQGWIQTREGETSLLSLADFPSSCQELPCVSLSNTQAEP